MVDIVPHDKRFNEGIRLMVSIVWCPVCGCLHKVFDDDEGGSEFGWHIPKNLENNS